MPPPERVAELEKKWEEFLTGVKDPHSRSVLAVMFEREYQAQLQKEKSGVRTDDQT